MQNVQIDVALPLQSALYSVRALAKSIRRTCQLPRGRRSAYDCPFLSGRLSAQRLVIYPIQSCTEGGENNHETV